VIIAVMITSSQYHRLNTTIGIIISIIVMTIVPRKQQYDLGTRPRP
jgi:hypothetical protein